tara:strand:- start:543 stop:896 length:354 start_codon:yes stop_codon:yes gene_type:complete
VSQDNDPDARELLRITAALIQGLLGLTDVQLRSSLSRGLFGLPLDRFGRCGKRTMDAVNAFADGCLSDSARDEFLQLIGSSSTERTQGLNQIWKIIACLDRVAEPTRSSGDLAAASA